MKKIQINEDFLVAEFYNGKTLTEIAISLKVSKDVIKYRAKKLGLKPKKGRKQLLYKIGYKTGQLTVISKPISGKRTKYLCRCSCGNEHYYLASSIKKNIQTCWNCRNKIISDKKWRGFGEISGDFWCSIKKSAKARDLSFEISIEDAWNLFLKQNRKCALSGIELNFSHSKKLEKYKTNHTASLDRIDSNKGYSIDNIQWVHKDINKMKLDLPEDKFIEYCKLIVERYNEHSSKIN